MSITYPPELLPLAVGAAEVVVVDPATGKSTTVYRNDIPDGPCVACDGSSWLDDDCTEMCCECDGTGTVSDQGASDDAVPILQSTADGRSVRAVASEPRPTALVRRMLPTRRARALRCSEWRHGSRRDPSMGNDRRRDGEVSRANNLNEGTDADIRRWRRRAIYPEAS